LDNVHWKREKSINYLQAYLHCVTFEPFQILTRDFLHRICESIVYTTVLLEISRDLDIYYVTGNAKILATTITQPKLTCALIIISALCSTSNVVSFMADCKTIMLVTHLVSNMQDCGRKPEVKTFLYRCRSKAELLCRRSK